MNGQTQYRITGAAFRLLPRPRRDALASVFDHWVKTGSTPRGITIDVRIWGKDWAPERTRRFLQKTGRRPIGCPGIVRYYADPHLILCDYDGPCLAPWPRVTGILRGLEIRPEWCEYHRTRRGWHLAIWTRRRLHARETLALQLLLGSDPHREQFNFDRLVSGRIDKRWNLLFESKL